jgi:hypothetical protein
MTEAQVVKFCAHVRGRGARGFVLQFLTDEANYQKEVNARVAALDRTYVVGITASFRRDDLSRSRTQRRVLCERVRRLRVRGRHAGGRPQPLEQQAGAERLDSQQVGRGATRACPRLIIIYILFFGERGVLCVCFVSSR